MSTKEKLKAGPKPRRTSLSRDKIVSRAVALADEDSLARLNMRSLAKALDCGVMSLYNHVASIDELHSRMVDTVVGEFELPADEADCKQALRRCALSAHETLLRHPWAVEIWTKAGMTTSNQNLHAFFEYLLRSMRAAGHSEAEACRGFHALTMHIVGFTAQQIELPFKDRTQFEQQAKAYVASLAEDNYPYVAEHVRHHLGGGKSINHFEFLLDLILDNLKKQG